MRPLIDPTVSFYGEPEPSLWARIVAWWRAL